MVTKQMNSCVISTYHSEGAWKFVEEERVERLKLLWMVEGAKHVEGVKRPRTQIHTCYYITHITLTLTDRSYSFARIRSFLRF